MNTKKPLQRAFFLVAGSAMNFLLAILLMILVLGIQGDTTTNVYINVVAGDSPAKKIGWLAGDRIVSIDGRPIGRIEDITQAGRAAGGRPLLVTIERRGKLIETSIIPRTNPPKGQGPMGVGLVPAYVSDPTVTEVRPGSPAAEAGLMPDDKLVTINRRPAVDGFAISYEFGRFAGTRVPVPVTVERAGSPLDLAIIVPHPPTDGDVVTAVGLSARLKPIFVDVPPVRIVPLGLERAWQQTSVMISGIRDLATGQVPLDQVAGPIGMGKMTSQLVQESPFPLWIILSQITILISLNLGILNLLPLPALDGGRLMFVVVELLRGGRRVAPEREGLVHFAGLVILIGLMVLISVVDIRR
jgi:regulator of sigma E protease